MHISLIVRLCLFVHATMFCNLFVCLFSVTNHRFYMSCLKDIHYICKLKKWNGNFPACRMFDCIIVCCGSLLCNGKWITGILFGVIECKITEGLRARGPFFKRWRPIRIYIKKTHLYFFFMWPVLQPKGLFEILHDSFSNKPWCNNISDEQEFSW